MRQNLSSDPSFFNVQPTTGDDFSPTHGLYLARNIVLIEYIAFAWKLTNRQLQSVVAQVPWTATDRFDIEARAAGDPTKDQYRLMMQSLLAERFHFAAHFETRVSPVFALVVAHPGKLGPQLRLHRAEDPVCAAPPKPTRPIRADADGFPEFCGGPVSMQPSAPGLLKTGGRGISLALFAAIEGGVADLGRPLLNNTGMDGPVDYTLEWTKVQANLLPGEALPPEGAGPTFRQALLDQMGLKLAAQKAPVEFFAVAHIEHPSPN